MPYTDKHSLGFGVVLLISGASSSADTLPVDPSEELFFADIPVVLSATRLKQPIADLPASMTVISRDMIEASGAMRLVELFRLIPGMQVGYVSGARFTVSQHGWADRYARRLQVLVDGRPVYDPGYGGVSWFNLPIDIDDIERIEAIRGPNAAAYGSNAFSGIINVITKHPLADPGTRLSGTAGEQNTRTVSLSRSGSAGDLDYRVTLKHQEDTGFENRYDTSDQNWMNIRGDWQINDSDVLHAQFGINDGYREDGFPYDDVNPPRKIGQQYRYEQFRWTRTLTPGEEYSVQFYHNRLWVDDEFKIPDYLLDAGWGFTTDRYDIEFQITKSLSPAWRVVGGIGARHDESQSLWLFNTRDSVERDQGRIFFNAEWHGSENTVANLGVMTEFTEGIKPLVSPRLGLNYHLDSSNTIRASASLAYRLPSLFEENADQMAFLAMPDGQDPIPINRWFYSYGNIQPERIRSFEIGYVGTFSDTGLSLESRIFNERISPTITEVKDPFVEDPYDDIFPPETNPDPGAAKVWSDGRVTIRGLELGLKYAPSANRWIYLGYSYLKGNGRQLRSAETEPVGGTHRDLSRYIPNNLLSLLGSYRFGNGIRLSSGFYYSDKVVWAGDGDEVPAYHRWDIKLDRTFEFPEAELDLALIYRHIDADQIDFYNDPEDYQLNRWDESLFLEAKLKFN